MNSERSEISRHEIEVVRVLLGQLPTRWLSNTEIHHLANGVAPRTVRHLTLKLVRLGLVDQAEVFPGHRFQMTPQPQNRNRGYYDRLRRTADILGASLP